MRTRTRSVGIALLCGAFVLSTLQTAQAGVISAQQYVAAFDRGAAMAKIDAVLARDTVQQELKRLGVAPEDAAARVAALTDQELELLAANLDELPAGGLLGTVGVVFIVLLVLELVGVIDIFKKI